MIATTKPITRADALSLIVSRDHMTRQGFADEAGCSRASADQLFATLLALDQIKPCGHERTPGRKTWRMQFCATSKGAK